MVEFHGPPQAGGWVAPLGGFSGVAWAICIEVALVVTDPLEGAGRAPPPPLGGDQGDRTSRFWILYEKAAVSVIHLSAYQL